MHSIGKKIKTLRQQKGWSQSEIAEMLSISIPAFSKL
jgi:transcriptional regulator with XRE-family HTH domain